MHIAFASEKKLLVEALWHLLKDKGDYNILGTIDSLDEERDLRCLAESNVIILTDPGFDCSIVSVLRKLQTLSRRKPVVLVSCKLELDSAAQLFEHGVRAILTKNCDVEELHLAITNAAIGKPYLTPAIAQALAADLYNNNRTEMKLSPRELEIMGYIARGTPTSEIAKRLRLSSKTVSTHKRSIKTRLNLHSTSQIVQYAIEHGFAQETKPKVIQPAYTRCPQQQ
jgi:DNA-binding NarL/FixJ family response regulator